MSSSIPATRIYFRRLGQFVSQHWLGILIGWTVVLFALYSFAPTWEQVTQDGDLDYMADTMPSVQGEKLLTKAFPHNRAKSQFAVIVGRSSGPLTEDDYAVADRLAVPMYNARAARGIIRSEQLAEEFARFTGENRLRSAKNSYQLMQQELEAALAAVETAIVLDASYVDAIHNRGLILHRLGRIEESQAASQLALQLAPELEKIGDRPSPAIAGTIPVLDVWTRHHEVAGEKMVSNDRRAQILLMQMANEFVVAENVPVIEWLEGHVAAAREDLLAKNITGLDIGISGSAAVGADILRESRKSIDSTELYTVVLVVLILAFVYRAPMLVGVPLLTIVFSLLTSTAIVAWLTQLHLLPGMDWWNFRVFTTTKIFIVVILFGAGTDFCLFLIARFREELAKPNRTSADAIVAAIENVGDALLGSAMTTIIGLGMMVFAEFGKFRNSGPAIGICLSITLLACLTLAPAMLRALGPLVFYPFGIRPEGEAAASAAAPTSNNSFTNFLGRMFRIRVWDFLADWIVTYPVQILTCSVMVMIPFAWYGAELPPVRLSLSPHEPHQVAEDAAESNPENDDSPHGVPATTAQRPKTSRTQQAGLASTRLEDSDPLASGFHFPPASWYRMRSGHERVTYDLLTELDQSSPSRQGTAIMTRHFPIGEGGPLVVVAFKEDGRFESTEGSEAIKQLTTDFYVDGVGSVRSIAEPLGDKPKRTSIMSAAGRKKIALQNHRLSRSLFLTNVPAFEGDVARFELVLTDNPFSIEATRTLNRVDRLLKDLSTSTDPFWQGTQFAYGGTTAAIRDLRTVTQRDDTRIKILVAIAVFLVLIVILRHTIISLYLIVSVLFSYYVTLGITEIFFCAYYGDTYEGLDWKLPLFLFVILVAVGQDYNIYLATRVLEEQKLLGPMGGLRKAIVQTGGIITSCGVIMAGTFVSMTSGTLRGMIEMGFALTLGIIIDTFVVRTFLVPAFLAIYFRRSRSTRLRVFSSKQSDDAKENKRAS